MLCSETAVTLACRILVRDRGSRHHPTAERPNACSSWGYGHPRRSVSLANRRHEAIGRDRLDRRGTLPPPRRRDPRTLSVTHRTLASHSRTSIPSLPHSLSRSASRRAARSRSHPRRSRSRSHPRRSRSPHRRRTRRDRRCARRPSFRRRSTRRLPDPYSCKSADARYEPTVRQDHVPARQGLLQR
jgi:hypothetical protein